MCKNVVVCVAAMMLFAGCQAPPLDRTGKMLEMAGQEAASIPNRLDRFGRQLNIANIQLQTGRVADADKMLLLARDTLAGAAKSDMDDFHRIAGWTALAQLGLRANDHDLALKSSDLAVAALNDVQPMAGRAPYVLSLAWVLEEVRGKDAAVELINSGGAWAAEITDSGQRRQALMAFASGLLAYDAFDNARTLLRRDADPAWRTDAMLALSRVNTQVVFSASGSMGRGLGTAGGGAGGRGGIEQSMPAVLGSFSTSGGYGGYGQDVRFESVFEQSGQ